MLPFVNTREHFKIIAEKGLRGRGLTEVLEDQRVNAPLINA
jgi:hypothetical protein